MYLWGGVGGVASLGLCPKKYHFFGFHLFVTIISTLSISYMQSFTLTLWPCNLTREIILNSCDAKIQRPKMSKLSSRQSLTRKNFPDKLRKSLSRLSSKKRVNCHRSIFFLHWLFIWLISPSFGEENFPDYPKIFQIIQKLSRLSRNFPDGPETFQCNFKGYTQKLSSRQCRYADDVFEPLLRLQWQCPTTQNVIWYW